MASAQSASIEILSHEIIRVREKFLTYEDASGTATIKQIKPEMFKEPNRSRSYVGYPKGAIWLSFSVINKVANQSDWNLFLPFAASKDLEVYVLVDGRLVSQQNLGYTIPIFERSVVNPLPTVGLNLPYGKEQQIFIRHKDPIEVNLEWYIGDNFQLHLYMIYWFGATVLFLGIIFAISLYNLFLWLTLRDRTYLAYLAFSCTMGAIVSVLGHVAPIYFGFPFEWMPYRDALIVMVPVTSLIFMRSFLQLKERSQVLDRITLTMIALLCLLFAARLAGYSIQYFIDPIISLTSLLIIIGGFTCVMQGFRPARVFLIAWGIFLFCVFFWQLGRSGVIPYTLLITNMAQLGNALEAILMSIALGERIRVMQDQALIAEEKAKDKFRYQQMVRVMCHDINNPLSIILMQTEVMEAIPTANKKSLERLKKATRVIQEIVASINASEAIRSGLKERELVYIQDAYQAAKFMFEQQFKEKEVDFKEEIEEGCVILSHRLSFENEVINNLVSNAIKFCDRGGAITIRGKTMVDHVLVEVIDNGIGIPENILKVLFKEEANKSRLGTKSEQGTGFGMILVKSCIEDFGGSVIVTSSEGGEDHGTCIAIRMPKPMKDQQAS